MSDLSHERGRLYALVDTWIADREEDNLEDARIDQAVIVAVVSGSEEDGERDGVRARWETSRVYVQLGIVHNLLLGLEAELREGT